MKIDKLIEMLEKAKEDGYTEVNLVGIDSGYKYTEEGEEEYEASSIEPFAVTEYLSNSTILLKGCYYEN